MARWWNNQYYQNPEIAGIRKTLGDSMIGSYARDVGDLRGMLNAEKTVEQVMRNKAAQGLAAQGPVLGGRIATAMGVKAPQAPYNTADDWSGTLNALATDYAWRKNRLDTSRAHSVLGETEKQHALLKAQTNVQTALAGKHKAGGLANIALAGRRKQAGTLDAAKAGPLIQQSELIDRILGDPSLMTGVLENLGIPPTNDPKVDSALAGILLLAPNRQQTAEAINTLQLTDSQKEFYTAKIAAASAQAEASKALAEKRESETEKQVGAGVGFGFENPVEIDVPWDETNFNDFTVEPSLYKSVTLLMQSGADDDIKKAVKSLQRYFSPEQVRYILQQIKNELGGG